MRLRRSFFIISKYIFFFFEAKPKTGKTEVGQGSLVVNPLVACARAQGMRTGRLRLDS
jgi:hypothetical protein